MIGLYRKRCKIYKQLPVGGPSRPSNSGDGEKPIKVIIIWFPVFSVSSASINLISTSVFPIHRDTANSFAYKRIDAVTARQKQDTAQTEHFTATINCTLFRYYILRNEQSNFMFADEIKYIS